MKRPQLNRHLTLERETTSADLSGGFISEWEPLGAHWAEITPGTGRETKGPAASIARVPYKIVVRSAPITSDARPMAGQRFKGQGRIYDIQAVAELDSKGRYLICHALEETAT